MRPKTKVQLKAEVEQARSTMQDLKNRSECCKTLRLVLTRSWRSYES